MKSKLSKTSALVAAVLAGAAVGAYLLVQHRSALPAGDASPNAPLPVSTLQPPVTGTVPASAPDSQGHPAGRATPIGAPVSYNRSVVDELNQLVLKERLPELLDRARHDPSLAYALSKALLQCEIADGSYAALADSAQGLGGAKKAEERMAELDRVFAKCKGMTGKALQSRYDLVTSAASAGLVEAQVDYRVLASEYVLSEAAHRHPEIAQEFHGNVVAFTNRAAATGNPDALFAAFRLYSDGMIVPPDAVLAYRYLRAYARANPSAATQQHLATFASQMSPEDMRRASSP